MAGPGSEAVKVEEGLVPVKDMEQQSRHDTTDRAGHNTDHQRRGAQCGAVHNELRVQQDAGHHKGGQPVLPHPAAGEGGGDGDGAVHTEGRRHPQQAGRDDAPHAPLLVPQPAEAVVDGVLGEHRHQGPDDHAQGPVTGDLPELEQEVIPHIDELPVQNLQHLIHQCSPECKCGCPGQSPRRVPACEVRSDVPLAAGGSRCPRRRSRGR